MKWFKHDTDAHADARLDKVLMHYGAEGYAVYWYCLELIAGKVSRENITFELEHDADQIGHRLKVDSKKVMAILQYAVDIGLFESSEGTITCLKLAKRLDGSMTGNPEMRKVIAGLKSPDTVMTQSGGSHDKVKKSHHRLDKTRLDKKTTSGFQPPELEEVRNYFSEKGFTVDPDAYHDYNTQNGWLKSDGKAIKSWKLNASTWQKNEDRRNADSQPVAEFIE